MTKKRLAPWQLPAIVSGVIIALGALGTCIVKSAKYIELPDAVAQEQKRNDSQDQRLDKLITLQEYEQQHPANQQATVLPSPPPTPRAQLYKDKDGRPYCWNGVESYWPNDQGSCE